MNRPEYSLSLDSVICRRCSTVSAAEELTCPACGADRQGAIFTSHADTAAARLPAPLDIVDLSDSGWLQRLVRRKMLTSYPNFVEPGDLPDGEPRKPARTGIAMLVGSVVASIAAGGYFYLTLDDNVAPTTPETGISAAGSVHDGASVAPAAERTRPAALTRSRDDAPAPANVAKANDAPEAHASAAHDAPVAAHATTQAAPLPPRIETPVATAKAPAHDIAPPVTIVATKPAPAPTTSVAASKSASDAAVTPSIKPPAPAIAVAQKPEPRETAAFAQTPVVAPAQKPAPLESARLPTPAPVQSTVLATAKPSTPAPAQKLEAPARPVTQPTATASQPASVKSNPTVAALDKPAAPVTEPLPAAVAHSIAAVQQALTNRDLTAARRHMRGLYASLPRSPEIQQLAADVSRQERARDSAMASARSCAVNQDPACALRHARRAVSLDPRNAQTQATLRRALAVQNESNTEYFRQASAIPAPTVPAMTFDGRWSAGTRHGAASGENGAPNFTVFGWGVPTVAKGRGDAH
ncbi:hypothetical protein AWB70_05630 [Caballeronia cordobensis]|uniref:Uncharacterized protein n=1 Tax=Caballeronia cordobensis TaxID=1353886 RepID=A0A158IZE0_CABCO|nr:hypothetical protein [Caballeronia cordobensis]SAL61968.1 hypothetical protein AWB70_05630 [Caballeronia cordobensis]